MLIITFLPLFWKLDYLPTAAMDSPILCLHISYGGASYVCSQKYTTISISNCLPHAEATIKLLVTLFEWCARWWFICVMSQLNNLTINIFTQLGTYARWQTIFSWVILQAWQASSTIWPLIFLHQLGTYAGWQTVLSWVILQVMILSC